MDASIPLAATIEHNTFAPLMANLPLGRDDSFSSPIEPGSSSLPKRSRMIAQIRSGRGCQPTWSDGFRPNGTSGRNTDSGALDYSPTWDANLYTWTEDAINNGYHEASLREEFQILTYVQNGFLTGVNATTPFGSAGFSINCPIVQRLN